MRICVLRTPTDMRQVWGLSFRLDFVGVPEELEKEVRGLADGIFTDLPYIDRSDLGLVSAYLSGITEPLRDLLSTGMQLVAVATAGSLAVPGVGAVPWDETEFIVAPNPLWFQAQNGEGQLVHFLGAQCVEGHSAFTKPRQAIRLWRFLATVQLAFEGHALWCPTCVLGGIEAWTRPTSMTSTAAEFLGALHPWVREAAERLWLSGHHRQAVDETTRVLELRLREKTGIDLSGYQLVTQAFRPEAPRPGETRLRFGDLDAASAAWKDAHQGAMHYAQGCMLRIRNLLEHHDQEPSAQVAVEYLHALSLLARWIDEARAVTANDGA